MSQNPKRKYDWRNRSIQNALTNIVPAQFAAFAKGEAKEEVLQEFCVIYTRVSSKEQEKGMSLEVQYKDCEQYTRKKDISVLGSFGCTYESAKTDERKEF